jgi:hypothetical protein
MARRAKGAADVPRLVRRTLLVDPTKLEQARIAVGARSHAEVVRLAIEHLLSHFPGTNDEEE